MIKFLLNIILFSFFLNAHGQTIDFTFESSSGVYCNPSSVIFKQACTGDPIGFIWNFGNGHYSDKAIDSTSYSTAGTYTVKLVAVFKTKTLELSKTVVINPTVKASIGLDKNYICKPGTINFTGPVSANVSTYEWNFGDGGSPSNTASSAISHTYTTYGTKYVQLKVTASSGCTDTSGTPILIKKIDITATTSRSRGCIPAVTNFTGDATIPANSSVTSYTWNFGDGSTPVVSASNTVNHTYSMVGDYFPTLTVVTSEGCSNTYNFSRFYFGTPPVNVKAFPQTNPICSSDSAVFIAHATNANRYYWQFGDGTSASTTDTIIKHKYTTLGNKIAKVKPYYNECDAPTFFFPITIKGVVANYSLSNSCSAKNIYFFVDSTLGKPTSRLWKFGDGFQDNNTVNPVHSFPLSGVFTTTLILNDMVSGCSDSMSKTVLTALPQLYTMDSSVCKNKTIAFSILDNYPDTAALYTWRLAGHQIDTVRDTVMTIIADSLGIFNNYVVINHSFQSCPDTVKQPSRFLVNGPQLNFTIPASICLNSQLMATNNSKPFLPADSVLHWYWDFDSTGLNHQDAYQPAPFQYTNAGTYSVKLSAVDIKGCEDSLVKALAVNPSPFLHITPLKDSLCYGKSLTLIAFHNNELVWSPARDLSCTTCDTTIATPVSSGTYYATATNSFNCSVRDSSFIDVILPFTASITPADIYLCQHDKTTFADISPKGKVILWSPAAGLSDPAIYNPVITATQDISYKITLTDSAGCFNRSTVNLNIHVKPLPVVDAGPDKFYSKGTSFSFTPTYSSNVSSYSWTPSAGLSCGDCAIPAGVATTDQLYIIKVTSDSGCVASDSVLIGVDCNSADIFMPKAFSPNNDNLNDLFYPITIGIKTITRFTIYNRDGRIVYEARNFSPNIKQYGWDGKFEGVNQSVGAYVYTLETLCEIGQKIFKKGSFFLIR